MDMERYYDVAVSGPDEKDILTPNGKRVPKSEKLPNLSIEAAIALRDDFESKIPRTEVEEIHAVVMAELETIRRGCVSTIVGG